MYECILRRVLGALSAFFSVFSDLLSSAVARGFDVLDGYAMSQTLAVFSSSMCAAQIYGPFS
jgi:hypothetical protein